MTTGFGPDGGDARVRRANRRTALVLAAIALGFFLAMIMTKFAGAGA